VTGSLSEIRASVWERGSSLSPSSWCACLLILACSMGCRSLAPASKSPIDQLHLLLTSIALNLDSKPGSDGVGVRIYASRRGDTTALPITQGDLDILMFDGEVPLKDLLTQKPLHTWSYPASKLKPHHQETSIGTSYRFAAVWGENKPTGDRVTFIARYTPPKGQPVYSAPGSVPLSVH
jgi:hypothetical protein